MKITRDSTRSSSGPLRMFLSKLGPGLITGAADDDPSGIGTYSIAGAQFGYLFLWTAWLLFPLMAAIQLICSRLGMVSGRGLGGLLRKHYGPWVLWPACALLIVANTVNIAADLGAMAASTAMVTGVSAWALIPFFTIVLTVLMMWGSYRLIARIFKWLTLVLFAYVISAFLSHPNWHAVWIATVEPHFSWSHDYNSTLVAVLGTTISPFLFFWQAIQEVEEEREQGKLTVAERKGATEEDKANSRVDIITGMLFSNLIMYFVVLTTGATLHLHGQTHLTTTQQVAAALGPLAGKATYLLFTLGIIGTGMLSVPVLAGSTAYAIAEGARWRESLALKPREAPQFYAVLAAAFLGGMALNYLHFGVVAMLFLSAVVNGVLAPPLIVMVVLLSTNRRVMGKHASGRTLQILGWITAVLMTFAAVGMFVA